MINPKDVVSDGFREITDPSEESPEIRARWTVPSGLAYFEGHFPGNPVLPGIALVDLTLELVRRWPGFEKAELAVLKSAKFTAPVIPGAEVEVQLTRGIEWRAEWTLGGDAGGNRSAASFLFVVRCRE